MNQTNANPAELQKFGSQAQRWWDPLGEFRTLHQVNPLRVGFIRNHTVIAHRRIVDVGCGGGILSEELARQGGDVLGVDLATELLDVAELHALESQVAVKYERISAEDLAKRDAGTCDIVTCMEMLEHVPDPDSIVQACADLAKAEGWVFFSTLNRNIKSYLLAVVAAEYLFGMISKGTHRYDTFIKPSELCRAARQANLELISLRGIAYDALSNNFRLNDDIDVNYLAAFRKRAVCVRTA